ncbi:rod shape-determining protein MreD [Streptomyces sp. NPDC049555]|uniref:rod shape-determining protein MreD n=1 Tax=unclassified Streptomyces TaxID=2593676 RepID=UPI00343AEA90
MRLNRILLSTVLVVVALVLQVSVFARLHLPGAVPDLMLLVVVGLGLVYGHTAGCLIGFGAGLLADLAPPADHATGRYALVLCVIGYLVGLAKPETGRVRSATVPMVAVVGAAVLSTLLYAGVGSLVGDTAARHVGLSGLVLTAAAYDLLLAPFTVPLVMALARQTAGDPLTGDGTPVAAASENTYRRRSAGAFRIGRTRRSRLGGRRGLMGTQRSSLLAGQGRKQKIKGVRRL